MEWIVANKEGLLAVGAAVLVAAGAVIKLTSTKSDDRFFNKVLNAVGLGRFAVTVEEEKKEG